MKVPKGASGNEAEKEQSLMRSTSMQKKYVLLWASSALLILDVQREICGETQGNRWPTTFSTVRTQLDIADATYLIADVQAFKPHSARAQVRKLKRMIWSRLLSVNSTSSSKLHDRRVGITLPSEDTVRISGEDEGYHSAVTDVGDVDMHQDHADEADDEETENINDDVDENGNLLGFIDDEEILKSVKESLLLNEITKNYKQLLKTDLREFSKSLQDWNFENSLLLYCRKVYIPKDTEQSLRR